MPVIFPGFSWYNLMTFLGNPDKAIFNQIPRRCGDFLWHQAYNLLSTGEISMFYVAMFDEIDEGTAIMPVVTRQDELPVGSHMVYLNIDGCNLPDDWYLSVTGKIAEFLAEGKIPPKNLDRASLLKHDSDKTVDNAGQKNVVEDRAEETLLDKPYGSLPAQRLDVYFPSGGSTMRPGVLIIHGRGWNKGDKAVSAGMCKLLAREGIVAVTINYRLADAQDPTTRWPAQLDDAKTALQWMIGHADSLGIDSKHICVFGHSAGGHIAVWLGMSDKRIAGVVDYSGPTDLLLLDKEKFKKAFFDLTGSAYDYALLRSMSPVFAIETSGGMPATLILGGENDTLVSAEQGRLLYEAMKNRGYPANLILYPSGHSFNNLPPESVKAYWDKIISFIKSSHQITRNIINKDKALQ